MNASEEVDTVLTELAKVARDREAGVQKPETLLKTLEDREKETREWIENLKNVPLPVAEYFANLSESGRNAALPVTTSYSSLELS